MTIGAISTGAQTVTTTGAVTPTAGLDISGITGDFTVHIRVQSLTAASGTPKARIILEDTVNAMTATIPVMEIDVQGPVDPKNELQFNKRKYEIPSARFGTASALARINVVSLGGTTPSLKLDSWVEY